MPTLTHHIYARNNLYWIQVEEQNHGANESQSVVDEITYSIRSLAYHPSLVLWNAGNELTYFTQNLSVYEDFVLPLVAREDNTRVVWPGSPSAGFESGVHTSNGLPNAKSFKIRRGQVTIEIETHSPYMREARVLHSHP